MNAIVVYFSRAGSNWVEDDVKELSIGNNEILAKYVQKKTGADIFKIETKRQYTDEYYKATEEAKEELKQNARPELVDYPENLDKYDKIYLVYPIWWSTCPMAIFTFLEKYNLDGKTIIPLCSHEGSGVANSVEDIKKSAKNAVVKNAYQTRGYRCQNLENDREMQDEIDNFLQQNK